MILGYREVVTPVIERWDARPSRAQLAAVLDHLRTAGWLRSEAKAGLVYLDPSRIANQIASTPEDRCLAMYLEGGPGGRYPQEWPEDQLEFSAELCEDVLVIDSPEALIMPTGDSGLTLPCSSCEEDLLSGVRDGSDADADQEPDSFASPADHGIYPAPARCPACGDDLQYSEMALMSEDERIDDVPFFRFGLVLSAVLPRPEPLVTVDPELPRALERICGVPFRSTAIEM